MLADSFDPKKATPSELRTQLEVAKERLIHRENEVAQLKKDLDITRTEMKQQAADLSKSSEEVNELKMQLEVAKERIQHKEERLNSKNIHLAKQKSSAKLQAFFASLLFLLATLLASFGTNMLTSASPDVKGYILVILACIAYALAAFMTIFILGEEVNL